jgi:pimeloyl-ACP methyl ester carboxylesterase
MALYVDEHGPADAPTIVFLHGGGGAGWMWTPQVEALSSEFHLLVPDLPEQGRSTDGGQFTMASAAAQVADLVRTRAHGGRAHVVGLSEGAQVAVQLLADAPAVVLSAIASSALVLPIPGSGWASGRGVLGFTYATSIAPLRGSDWWIRTNMRSAAGVPDAYFEHFRESFRTLSKSGFVDLMVANQAFRLPAGLDRVTAPVLAVCGHGEYEVMRRSTADIAAAIPGAHACEVFHAGKMTLAQQHNWNMTAPELFNEMVRAFIGGRALPEAIRPPVIQA